MARAACAAMPLASKAVFLSYASEDSEVAQRIADGLRAAGLEVWFDRTELRGGEAWDQEIRHRIRDCRLFIPIISAHTEARLEGYFRREWKLAAERTDDMASRLAFLLPVVVDATSEASAEVPEHFRRVQWIRLPGGEASPGFAERVRKLMSPDSVAPATAADAMTVAGAAHNAAAGRAPERRRWWPLLVGSALCLLLGYLAFDRLSSARRGTAMPAASSLPSGPIGPAAVPPGKSVAVLPLKNESGDPKQEYFSDGLSESLINALSQLSELKVIGRTSAFHFRNSQETSASIGRQLGVGRLVEGSVQREGTTVRVSAELIDAADGRTLWSERYDRPYKNLFALQDEITKNVAQALQARLLPAAQAKVAADRPPSGNLDAYALYLQSQYYGALGAGPQAIEVLRRAIAIDPNYAAAWIQLAGNYFALASYAYIEPARNHALAREALGRAVALAPNDASALYLSAIMRIQYDHDPKGAAADMALARRSSPGEPMPQELATVTGCLSGPCYERFILDATAAIDRDPLNAVSLDYRGLARYFAGELKAAESDWRRIIAINPDYGSARYYIAQILVAEHRPTEALAIASEERLAVNRKAGRAFALVALGRRAEAEAELRDMITHDANDGPREIAEVCAVLGEKQKALDWLQRDYDDHHAGVFYLRHNPLLQNLRDEPRFNQLMDRIWPGT